jgi:hypothetical protein
MCWRVSPSTRIVRTRSQQPVNTEFNCLLWMPPTQERAGNIVLVDSTNFTTLFGGTESLANFWRNLATLK